MSTQVGTEGERVREQWVEEDYQRQEHLMMHSQIQNNSTMLEHSASKGIAISTACEGHPSRNEGLSEPFSTNKGQPRDLQNSSLINARHWDNSLLNRAQRGDREHAKLKKTSCMEFTEDCTENGEHTETLTQQEAIPVCIEGSQTGAQCCASHLSLMEVIGDLNREQDLQKVRNENMTTALELQMERNEKMWTKLSMQVEMNDNMATKLELLMERNEKMMTALARVGRDVDILKDKYESVAKELRDELQVFILTFRNSVHDSIPSPPPPKHCFPTCFEQLV